MRYKMWTGPCWMQQVADALTRLPDVSRVLAGTEHVYFDSPHSLLELERAAHHDDKTRPCWTCLPNARRVLHLDASLAPTHCTHDISCPHCGDAACHAEGPHHDH